MSIRTQIPARFALLRGYGTQGIRYRVHKSRCEIETWQEAETKPHNLDLTESTECESGAGQPCATEGMAYCRRGESAA